MSSTVFSLPLIFFRGTVVFRNSYCQEDVLEVSNFFVRIKYFLQKASWSRPFYKVVRLKQYSFLFEKNSCGRPFILTNVLASFGGPAYANHSFMQSNLFHRTVAAIHSFMGYMEEIFLTAATYYEYLLFWKSYFRRSVFLRIVYLFHHSNYSHSSFEVGYLLSQKEQQLFKGYRIYFDGRSCSRPLFEQFFQQEYVYLLWYKNVSRTIYKTLLLYLQKKLCVTIRDFIKSLMAIIWYP